MRMFLGVIKFIVSTTSEFEMPNISLIFYGYPQASSVFVTFDLWSVTYDLCCFCQT